ncbi:MAG: glycosyltransferase, partial [Pyrinomonadaceae bacterium]
MRIIHINTTNKTGGAAEVARALESEQLRRGHDAGLVSRETLGNSRYLNALVFRLSSHDGLFARWRELLRSELFRSAEVIHLHNAHGYYMPPWALSEIVKKPCLWTLHDYWLLTGRCAMPEECTGFKSGCAPCPYKEKYPATWLDRAAVEFQTRRGLLKAPILFVSPSESTSENFRDICRSLRVIHNPVNMPNQLPTRIEARLRLGLPENRTIVLFAARRLEEPRKGLRTL